MSLIITCIHYIIYVIRYKEIPSTLEMISKLSKFYFNSLYPKLCCSVPDFFHSCINHKMSRAESIIQTNKNGFSKPMLACAWMPLCKSSRNLSNIWARIKDSPYQEFRFGIKKVKMFLIGRFLKRLRQTVSTLMRL